MHDEISSSQGQQECRQGSTSEANGPSVGQTKAATMQQTGSLPTSPDHLVHQTVQVGCRGGHLVSPVIVYGKVPDDLHCFGHAVYRLFQFFFVQLRCDTRKNEEKESIELCMSLMRAPSDLANSLWRYHSAG